MTNFLQGETWTDKEGTAWDIDAMLPSHRKNTLAFVRRQEARILGELIWMNVLNMADDDGLAFEDLPLVVALREAVEADEIEDLERRQDPCY
jgi:hypothetical protein